ncbi:MAG: toxin-antitoxin system YwqK family antitoxin [Planctomycetes bacterium]|nr:toxin-antitoxin system YwqK family antitoxin [Planctomycetota bacterium]
MLTTMPKLATLAACAALGLAGTWIALAEGPTPAHAMKPCACILDETTIREGGEALSPLELTGPCGPLELHTGEGADQAVDSNDGDAPQLTSTVNYYRDGDVIQTTFRDEDGVVRRTGSYRLAIAEPQREPANEPTDLTPQIDPIIDKLVEEVERVERVEECIKCVKAEVFAEESDFDPARVPPGVELRKLRDGTWREFRGDGSCASEINWREGLRDGAYYTWHTSGVLATSGSYCADAQSGRWTIYSESGQLASEMGYINGALDGSYIQYHSNGRVSACATYENGVLSEGWTYYDEEGNTPERLRCGELPTKDVVKCRIEMPRKEIDRVEPAGQRLVD